MNILMMSKNKFSLMMMMMKFRIFAFSDEEDEPIGRRRRRESRRNGEEKRRSFLLHSKSFSFTGRTLVDTSNSGSPTTGRLSHGVRSVSDQTTTSLTEISL